MSPCDVVVIAVLTKLACELEESAELAQLQVVHSGTSAGMLAWAHIRNERRDLAARLRSEVRELLEGS